MVLSLRYEGLSCMEVISFQSCLGFVNLVALLAIEGLRSSETQSHWSISRHFMA